jgi:hypothetical protein
MATMRIGIDFDNTLIDYDAVFATVARERGLIDGGFVGSKREVRDHIRALPDGETEWQRLQGYVYGAGIQGATMFDGVDAFLRQCRAREVEVCIVSHKTRFGHFDTTGINLRAAAVGWMARNGFFAADGYAIPVARVFFESTRTAKVNCIRAAGCSLFIDDLVEVFADSAFPEETRPILFADTGEVRGGTRCATWAQVAAAVFDG